MEIDSIVKRGHSVGSGESTLVHRGVEAVILVHATFQKMLRKLPTTSAKGCLEKMNSNVTC